MRVGLQADRIRRKTFFAKCQNIGWILILLGSFSFLWKGGEKEECLQRVEQVYSCWRYETRVKIRRWRGWIQVEAGCQEYVDLWFVHRYCAQILRTDIVHRYCAQLLCTDIAHSYWAQILRTAIEHRYCAQLLCTDIVHSYCTQILCTICSRRKGVH